MHALWNVLPPPEDIKPEKEASSDMNERYGYVAIKGFQKEIVTVQSQALSINAPAPSLGTGVTQ